MNKWENIWTNKYFLITILAITAIAPFAAIYFVPTIFFVPTDKPTETIFSVYLHLTLPMLVLVIEFYMLCRMARESKERRETEHELRGAMQQIENAMQQMEGTTQQLKNVQIALGRTSYMAQIHSAINRAEREIIFTTATMETSHKSKDQEEILKAVLHRKTAINYSHRGLVAKRPETLPGAIELLKETHIELRMSG